MKTITLLSAIFMLGTAANGQELRAVENNATPQKLEHPTAPSEEQRAMSAKLKESYGQMDQLIGLAKEQMAKGGNEATKTLMAELMANKSALETELSNVGMATAHTWPSVQAAAAKRLQLSDALVVRAKEELAGKK